MAAVYFAALGQAPEKKAALFSTRPSATRGIRGFRFRSPNLISRAAVCSAATRPGKLHSLFIVDTYSVHYRDDAKKLEEWGRSQDTTTLVDFSSRGGDVENILKDIADRVQGMGHFTYSRFFAVGIFRLLELANAAEASVLEKFIL